jgi:DNA-binding XRE family transcriptional regulator
MADTEQAKLLKQAKETLGLTTEALAVELGATRDTLNNWLAEKSSPRYRPMPKMARLLLARILAERRKRKSS